MNGYILCNDAAKFHRLQDLLRKRANPFSHFAIAWISVFSFVAIAASVISYACYPLSPLSIGTLIFSLVFSPLIYGWIVQNCFGSQSRIILTPRYDNREESFWTKHMQPILKNTVMVIIGCGITTVYNRSFPAPKQDVKPSSIDQKNDEKDKPTAMGLPSPKKIPADKTEPTKSTQLP